MPAPTSFCGCFLRVLGFCGFVAVSSVVYVVVASLIDSLERQAEGSGGTNPKTFHFFVKDFWAAQGWWNFVAGLSATMASLSALRTIVAHLRFNKNKRLMWCIFRILLLVPIYSVDAYICLKYAPSKYHWAYILTAIREIYEAVVLVSFVQFVVAFLGEGDDDKKNEKPGPEVLAVKFSGERVEHLLFLKHIFPSMSPGSGFVSTSLLGILQYALVMCLVVILNVGLWVWELNDHSHEKLVKQFDQIPHGLKAVSNGLAMYSLVLFYHETLHCPETEKDMRSIQPYNKFVCIKGIVLLTFWQTGTVQILIKMGYMWGCTEDGDEGSQCHEGDWTKDQMGTAILNFVLCIEMLLFAEWHRMAFPVFELAADGTDPPAELGVYDEICGVVSLVHPSNISLPTRAVLSDTGRFLRIGDMLRQIMILRSRANLQRKGLRELRAGCRKNDVTDEELKTLFNAFDLNDSKTVKLAQLKFALMFCEGKPASEVDKMANEADVDKDGCISFEEFRQYFFVSQGGLDQRLLSKAA